MMENRSETISVVIPTYQRPEYLKACLRSVVLQTLKPNQICVISRDTDRQTHEAFEHFKSRCENSQDIRIELVKIQQAGFLPPIQAGINASEGDIVAFIDDDAEAYADWLQGIKAFYENPRVGGVGGRVVNIYDGLERKYKPAKVFGRFYWYGRLEGNLYKDGAIAPIAVDCFMGGNMSYRKILLNQICIDMRMNNAVAANYEIDLGLQIKKLGYELIYTPLAKVNHFSAGQIGTAPRKETEKTVYWSNFNTGYLVAKHTHGFRLACICIYEILIGQFSRWGVLSTVWYCVRFKKFPPFLFASVLGRYAGIRTAVKMKS